MMPVKLSRPSCCCYACCTQQSQSLRVLSAHDTRPLYAPVPVRRTSCYCTWYPVRYARFVVYYTTLYLHLPCRTWNTRGELFAATTVYVVPGTYDAHSLWDKIPISELFFSKTRGVQTMKTVALETSRRDLPMQRHRSVFVLSSLLRKAVSNFVPRRCVILCYTAVNGPAPL